MKNLFLVLISLTVFVNSCKLNNSDNSAAEVLDSDSEKFVHNYIPERLIYECTMKYYHNDYSVKVINDVFFCKNCGDKYYTHGCKRCIITNSYGREDIANTIEAAYRASLGLSKSKAVELESGTMRKLREFYYEKGYEKDYPAVECK